MYKMLPTDKTVPTGRFIHYDGLIGYKDGKFVEIAVPGAEIVIKFDWGEMHHGHYYYFISRKHFFRDFMKKGDGIYHSALRNATELSYDDEVLILGRLAEQSGFDLDKEPIGLEEEVATYMMKDMTDEIDNEVLSELSMFAKERK